MAFGILALPLASSAVQAAQPEVPHPSNSEIIVTGERIPQSLRQTSSSVSVITAEQIQSTPGADRIEDLLVLIPNVQLGSGSEAPTIRGQDATGAMRDLPAFLGGNRPRTTLIVDGRAVSFNEFLFGIAPLWEIERVEVFRTPQTTTQGRNSIAGAIFIHSADPGPSWQGRLRAVAGDPRTIQLSAAASGPVGGSGLGVGASADWRRSRPSSEIGDNMRGADPDRDEYGVLRLKAVAQPEALADTRIELTAVHSRSQMPQVEGIERPFEERRNPNARYGVFRVKVSSATASIETRPGADLAHRAILSAGRAKATRFAPPGLGEARNAVRDWSAETVLDWTPAERFRTTVGASFVDVRLDQRIDLSQLSGIGEFDDVQRSLGIFGELRWTAFPGGELVAGARYQRDWQRREGALAANAGSIPLDYRKTFDAWLPKVSLSVQISPSLLAGVLVQRAYNPGGATLRFDTGLPDELDAERLWNYELFARASLGRRLNGRLNIFRTDVRDAQRARPIVILAPTGAPVTFADLFNVARSATSGAELELEWRPAAGLRIDAGAGFLWTKITDPGAAPASLEGKVFQRSPKFSGAVKVSWDIGTAIRLSGQVRHNSGYFSDDANTPILRISGTTIVDARASLRRGRWQLFGYVRNLFDRFSLTSLANANLATATDPREIGFGLETGI